MVRIVTIILFLLTFLNANVPKESLQTSHNEILKSFDVDKEFIQSFHGSKIEANRYKTWYFLKVLRQGSDFIPTIKKILKKEKVPLIFLYLAMAESNFSPHATSYQKAAGLWQFVTPTARKYGLKVSEYIDERRDPIKSTKSAIKYLKDLYGEFGKWYLAAMAYNCGSTRVRKAIKRAKSDDLGTLLDNDKKYIPRETRNYIRKILSLAVMSQQNENKINGQDDSEICETVSVPPVTTLSSVAQSIGVSAKKVKKLNPQLKYYFTPPGKNYFQVYIPCGTKDKFVKNFKATNRYNGFEVHVVKKGDSLWSIGKKYGIKYSLIKSLNHLKSKNLRIKQKIIIPVVKEEPIIYIVKRGDTLGEISRKFKIKTSALKKENNIKKYIRPGDKLVIPSKQ